MKGMRRFRYSSSPYITVMAAFYLRYFVDCFAVSLRKPNCSALQGTNWENSRNSPLQWRHNGRHGVSKHQSHDCLLNHLFRRRSKKISKLRVTGLCVRGIHRWPVNSPHKWPVTRKLFPFHNVIMPLVYAMHFIANWAESSAGEESFYLHMDCPITQSATNWKACFTLCAPPVPQTPSWDCETV